MYIRGLGEMNTLEYKEKIIELITAIENEWILDRILKFIQSDKTSKITNEWIEKIVELLNKVEDSGKLEYLHTFIRLFVEKWGC